MTIFVEQRTVDWFMPRIGRFTSTTLHTVINVCDSIYFDDPYMKLLHVCCKNTVMISPMKDVTLANYESCVDKDIDNLHLNPESVYTVTTNNKTDPRKKKNST